MIKKYFFFKTIVYFYLYFFMSTINELKEYFLKKNNIRKLEDLQKQKKDFISLKKHEINKIIIAKNTGFSKNFGKIL